MITKEQAMTENQFHSSLYKNSDGTCQRWRRNGATQTWKTRESDFRVPIKYGIGGYMAIDRLNAQLFHLPEDCPNKKEK